MSKKLPTAVETLLPSGRRSTSAEMRRRRLPARQYSRGWSGTVFANVQRTLLVHSGNQSRSAAASSSSRAWACSITRISRPRVRRIGSGRCRWRRLSLGRRAGDGDRRSDRSSRDQCRRNHPGVQDRSCQGHRSRADQGHHRPQTRRPRAKRSPQVRRQDAKGCLADQPFGAGHCSL
jgi:hypothetical protein